MTKQAGPLAKTIRGLLALHDMALTTDGLESDEAERIRDEGDKPWLQLNDQQRSLANQLSTALIAERKSTP